MDYIFNIPQPKGFEFNTPVPTGYIYESPIIQGVQGPVGPIGPQGSGATGPQGADSVIAGPTGPQGNVGLPGLPGPQGSQGPQGVNGSTGATGSQGPQGSNGVNGATGSQGPQGSNGTNGTNGTNGATGSQGTQGFQGPTGAGNTLSSTLSSGNSAGTYSINMNSNKITNVATGSNPLDAVNYGQSYGYTLQGGNLGFSPADLTTYYCGQPAWVAPITGAGNAQVLVPKAGTIKKCLMNVKCTSGTAESFTYSLRLNNTTDYTITNSATLAAASQQSVSYTHLTLPTILRV